MPDDLRDALGGVVHNEDFRASAAAFMSLQKDAVDKLVEMVSSHPTLSIPASGLDDFESSARLMGRGKMIFSAAMLIRGAARSLPEHLRTRELSAFASIIGADSYVPDNFLTFFSDLPGLDDAERMFKAVAFAPTLLSFSMTADLRVISADKDSLDIVPVCFARLEFDELIAGQKTHFFQVQEPSLELLKQEIERIQVLLSAARNQLMTGNDDD